MSFDKKKVSVNNQTFLTLVNTGISEDDVVKQAQEIKKLQPEMMEWRIDYFEDVVLMNRLLEVAGKVKTVMDKTPVLITFRSKKFGGKTELDSEDAYLNLVKIAIDFKLGNAIDIERDHVSDRVAGLIQDAKAKELGVVLS
jgi:3-dehydroquinate dehydratase-1